MTALVPIVNAPNLYVNGLSYAANIIGLGNGTSFTITPGAARDSTNTNDIISNNNITINTLVNGVNGLDTGTIATNSVYAVYIIGDSSDYHPTAGLVSLAPITTQFAPVMPSGYDLYRRIGVLLTNTTTGTTIVPMFQLGSGSTRSYYLVATLPALTAGNATTFTPVTLQNIVPSFTGNEEVYFNLTYTSASAANTVDFNAFGTSPNVSRSNGAASTTITPIWLMLRDSSEPQYPTFNYRTTSASDSVTLTLAGFKDYL